MDPGTGLTDGWNLGAMVQPNTFCPGVSPLLNKQYIQGRGKAICPLCLNYFRNQGFHFDAYADLDCPSSMYDMIPEASCYLCPPPQNCNLVSTISALIGTQVMILIFLGLLPICCY